MPTIFVKGKQVPVSEEFFNLPLEKQEATIRQIGDRIAYEAIIGLHRPGEATTNTSTKADRELSVSEYAEDAAKSFGVGVAKGAIGLAGLAGDIREGVSGASGWLAERLGVSPENSTWIAGMVRDGIAANPVFPIMQGPTSDEITDLVRKASTPAPTATQLVTREYPQSFIDRIPRSTGGEIIQTFGEHVPAALTGPGGVIRKTAMAVIPTALNETAGRVARATGNEEYEPWARLGGTLVGGGLAFGDKLNAIKEGANTLTSKFPVAFNPIPKPQRSFGADYTGTPTTGPTGRLRYDLDGRELIAPNIIGRQTPGGPDIPATPVMIRSIGEEIVPKGIQSVSPSDIRGNAGLVTFDKYSGSPISIRVSNKLSPQQTEKVVAHEVAHAIKSIAGRIPIEGIKRELQFIYNALNTGRERTRNLTLPENIGYTAAEAPDELMSEAIRAYMADPNWIKTMAPKTAARIREWVNTHPKLSKIVQFNSLGAAITGATLGAGGQSGEVNAAEAAPESSPERNILEIVKPLSSIPLGLAGQATKAGGYGLDKLTKALSRRGFHSRAQENEKFRDIARILADLNAK